MLKNSPSKNPNILNRKAQYEHVSLLRVVLKNYMTHQQLLCNLEVCTFASLHTMLPTDCKLIQMFLPIVDLYQLIY